MRQVASHLTHLLVILKRYYKMLGLTIKMIKLSHKMKQYQTTRQSYRIFLTPSASIFRRSQVSEQNSALLRKGMHEDFSLLHLLHKYLGKM
jgi:hypothetical protein